MNKIILTLVLLVSAIIIGVVPNNASAFLTYHDRYDIGFTKGCQSAMYGTVSSAYYDHSPTWWTGFDAGWAACNHSSSDGGGSTQQVDQQQSQPTVQKVYCINVKGDCTTTSANTQAASTDINTNTDSGNYNQEDDSRTTTTDTNIITPDNTGN
jgi:hypothetical protein